MASSSSSSASSSSSQRPKWNYDVFLSFRGEDTRKTFTSHLYKGLDRMGIVTFQDDKRLEQGSSITEELCKAIEESKFAIVIFSKNYASSGWCLDELVMIMKCKDKYGMTVIPVFYDVDPSTVRRQQGSFAGDFAKHETRYKDDAGMRKVQRWRDALFAAADLTGHDIRNRIEAECIQKIVEEIFFEKCKSTHLSSLQDVVGISTHLEKLKSLLEVETNDIRIVGIWGMGGVGKTTIAQAIFSYLTHHFDATCFLANVRGHAEKYGMHSLQNTLLSDLLRKKGAYVNNKEAGKNMIASTCWKRVLIVLDDINHKDHMEYLAGDLGWFGKGSRVIVTTRNKHLIEKDNALYKVPTLPDHEAMQVFSQHAFKKVVPDQGFEELSQKVVNHAKGLPLALKVWGGSLHNRDIDEWKRFIEQMKKSVDSEIVEKLKISYDDLEPIQQQMFLDIACFFRGEDKGFVMGILESCFGANIGLSVLIERYLVVISENDNIEMHDLIQDIGEYIVNVQKKPGKRSRLWLTKDIEEVMMNNTGTDTIEAIRIMTPSKLQISEKALEYMDELRMLLLEDEYEDEDEDAESEDEPANNEDDVRISFHDDTFKYLSNNLSCFVWQSYRGKSLPPNFEPKGLVHLELSSSSLRHLWSGRKNLTYLRRLNLSGCWRLIETPDFSGMANLEYLDLRDCGDLRKVHPSLGICTKLIRLDLYNCERLKRFPCVNVKSLEYLCLKSCRNLEKFPEFIGSMKSELEIDMDFCGIRELPSSIFQYPTRHITKLELSGLKNIVTLPNSICKLKSLVTLDVSYCSKLESLPEDIGDLENLEVLHAEDTLILRPPSSIVLLNKLKVLSFRKLYFEGHFVFPRVNQGLRSLEELNLSYCNLIDGGLPDDIGCLHYLKRLCLRGINCDYLPRSIPQLGALEFLDLSYCDRLRELPELPPNVEELWADYHMDQCIQNSENLKRLVFTERLWGESDDAATDLFEKTLLKCISSLQKAQRVFYMFHPPTKIPIWIKYHNEHQNIPLVKLPENWYANDTFLGLSIFYSGISYNMAVELILSNDDGSEKLSKKLPDACAILYSYGVHFYFIPFASLWDTSKANGNTPNVYGHLKFSITRCDVGEYGFRLLYKDDHELEALLHEIEDNHKSREPCIGIKRSRYDNGEHHDSLTNEASCS